MQTLQLLFEKTYKNIHFYSRKVSIDSKKTIICGPRKSGKSYLILDHLSNYEKESYLYIDFSDERIEPHLVAENLPIFLQKNPIKLLVIDHFDFSFQLPKVDEIIITTEFKNKEIEGFTKIWLFPLDFEEFISFEKKLTNIEHLFNLYTNYGTLPYTNHSSEQEYQRKIQSMLRLVLNDNTTFSIFKRFCELQGSKISLFQIYTQLKSFTKISKDKLYAITANLVEQQLLFLIEKWEQPNAAKKVYLLDFTFKDALSFKKDFPKRFENMVFLELLKRGKTIYYDENIDIYLPNERGVIFCSAFATPEAIEAKMRKLIGKLKTLNVTKVEIITLGNESTFTHEGIKFALLPFWQWALQL